MGCTELHSYKTCIIVSLQLEQKVQILEEIKLHLYKYELVGNMHCRILYWKLRKLLSMVALNGVI